MVVAAVLGSVTNHRPYKPATISACYVPSVQWRVVTWCLAATMLLILQGCSGVLKAADEQTPTLLGEAPAIREPELNTPSVEISIPENVQEVSEEKEPETPAMIPTPLPPRIEAGLASWYGAKHHGKRTASGERFDQKKLTAAHPTLPWGSIVRVTSLTNGKSVDVRINDRGPFIKGRIIDLSRAAARALGMVGLMQVQLEVLTPIETAEPREFIQDEQHQAAAQASNHN
jgi:rare lipoprotein A